MDEVSETDRLIPWFTLKSVPGIGNLLFKRLIERFKSPEAVFQAAYSALIQVEGISPRLAALISEYKTPDYVRREIEYIQQKNCRIVLLTDPEYPELLKEIYDPPPFLYVKGTLDGLSKNIAVVGSRSPTRYGLLTTKQLCEALARMDMTVVSGMARGIDTAAHIGALSGKGKTVAVLGSGLEKIYPFENLRLFEKIIENGAVISEFHLDATPDPHHFPARNRIISGMCLGTVVVEAAQKSGSLITARLAMEQGRDVFAVPGSVHSFKSMGTHSLIKQGAKLVENAKDILDELFPTIKSISYRREISQAIPNLSADEMTVLKSIGPYPIHIDDLTRKISMDSGKLSGILLELELKDIVQQSPGKLFSSEYRISESVENFGSEKDIVQYIEANIMPPQVVPHKSEEEYLEFERNSDIKHEYFNGKIFAMSGASEAHNLIVANVVITLGNQLKKRHCRVYPSDMRLKIEKTKLYTYPDVMIVCGHDKFADNKEDMLLNPDVIIEVLSDSTASYDRVKKFEHYRKIESFKEYVLISQNIRKIERFLKTENRRWIWDEADDENPEIILESVGCVLNLDEVYDKVL